MTDLEFREKALGVIDPEKSKLWLANIVGPRLDFLWSAGSEQLTPVAKVARQGTHILIGQCVPESLNSSLDKLLTAFVMALPKPTPEDD